MNEPRASHGLVAIDRWIYAFCGRDENGPGPLGSIERLNVTQLLHAQSEEEKPVWQMIELRVRRAEDGSHAKVNLKPRYDLMVAPFGSS